MTARTPTYRGGVCPHGIYRDTRCFNCEPDTGIERELAYVYKDELERLRRIEAAAREEMRTRDIARAIAGRHAEAGYAYTDSMPELEAATVIATDAEDVLRAALAAATPAPGWEELRREIERLAGELDRNADWRGDYRAKIAVATMVGVSEALRLLAAARGEPEIDVERVAALEEFLAASDAVEEGVVDFTLHASAVERLRAARKALG